MNQVVAFGDNFNDLSMLESAGLGVAIGQSDDAIKARADVVIGDNEAPYHRQFHSPAPASLSLRTQNHNPWPDCGAISSRHGCRVIIHGPAAPVWYGYLISAFCLAEARASTIRRSTRAG